MSSVLTAAHSGLQTGTLLTSLIEDGEFCTAPFAHWHLGSAVETVTRGELLRSARRYAGFYQHKGVRTGEVVIIILPHGPDLAGAFFGAMLLGAIPSFMPTRTSKQDATQYWQAHARLFQRYAGDTLLTSAANAAMVRENLPDLPLRLLEVEAASHAAPSGDLPGLNPTTIAFLQHSSGTTGLKKGVALTHRAVRIQIEHYAIALRLAPDDVIASWLPLYHDMGLIACFLLPLSTRTPVVLLDPLAWVADPASLLRAISRHRATLCWQPNFAFHHLCRTVRPAALAGLDLSSMRCWIDCSEPCRPETFRLFARTFAKAGVHPQTLQVCYAMAETVFAVTQTNPDSVPVTLTADDTIFRSEHRLAPAAPGAAVSEFVSTGKLLPGLELKIAGPDDATLPDGTIGEILLRGDFLFDGYYHLPEETARKLRDGWYHTGDLGGIIDGELYVTGRKNDLIIVHGKNYYAQEIEALVNTIPGVHPGRCVALGWARPDIGSEDVIVIAETRPDTDRAALVATIKQELLDRAGLLPYDVHLVDSGWLLKTTSGKIQRHENLLRYLAMLN